MIIIVLFDESFHSENYPYVMYAPLLLLLLLLLLFYLSKKLLLLLLLVS